VTVLNPLTNHSLNNLPIYHQPSCFLNIRLAPGFRCYLFARKWGSWGSQSPCLIPSKEGPLTELELQFAARCCSRISGPTCSVTYLQQKQHFLEAPHDQGNAISDPISHSIPPRLFWFFPFQISFVGFSICAEQKLAIKHEICTWSWILQWFYGFALTYTFCCCMRQKLSVKWNCKHGSWSSWLILLRDSILWNASSLFIVTAYNSFWFEFVPLLI